MDLKYKEGDRVRIKSIDWYNENKDKDGEIVCGEFVFLEGMKKFCSETLTILEDVDDGYLMLEDDHGYVWTDEMIEGLVEEETKPEFDYVAAMEDLMGLDIERSCILNEYDEYQKAVKEHGYNSEEALTRKMLIYLRKIGTAQNVLENFGFNLPEDYVLKDENGNVIDTHKIVLEKKKKAYPKTFEECVHVLEGENRTSLEQMNTFRKLIDARNAYWKLYGEEIGLEKPWEPDWYDDDTVKYCIIVDSGIISKQNFRNYQFILAFPTPEIRDAFYEYFKELIEQCKELL